MRLGTPAPAQKPLNRTLQALGFDVDTFDGAYEELPLRHGEGWESTGLRRCWDEAAVLSRLPLADAAPDSLARLLHQDRPSDPGTLACVMPWLWCAFSRGAPGSHAAANTPRLVSGV